LKRPTAWAPACWLALLLWACVATAADGWISGRVVSVTDGDTAVVETTNGRSLRVRFYGVDAPEHENRDWPAQPYSAAAHRFIRGLIADRPVAVRLTGDLPAKLFLRLSDALLDLDRDITVLAGERVLFLHTGGMPALFAYQDVLLG
jgi:hypothetical protein